MDLDRIERCLQDAGLSPRGAFHPACGDGVPPLAFAAPARTLVLAGNAGPRMWGAFDAARSGGAMTLDQWSEDVLRAVAARLGARAVFAFERPYLPFQRWAMRAEACHPSPLGLLIHPDYGLWHGYRGALLFAAAIALPPPEGRASPCAGCADRPCLSACPAGAFEGKAYDVPACARHLSGAAEPACMDIGCLARHACPVGRDYRYAPAQARFHMDAFLKNVSLNEGPPG
ncbi:MAG: 4Fe-4S dicluster domain-containing protein [Burkholderiales bacterium]|nr:4Fe-4S dicluster domain-containing protein [Burkholderiales bacterium]